jgi:hypothetical protein
MANSTTGACGMAAAMVVSEVRAIARHLAVGLRVVGVAHAKSYRVPRQRPLLAERATDIAATEDGDVHSAPLYREDFNTKTRRREDTKKCKKRFKVG